MRASTAASGLAPHICLFGFTTYSFANGSVLSRFVVRHGVSIAGDPRMNVNVLRVHDSYKMATVTTCARGALEFFVQVISSSLGSI